MKNLINDYLELKNQYETELKIEIRNLELKLENETMIKLENEISEKCYNLINEFCKDFANDFSLENSDFTSVNDIQGIDFHLDISDLMENIKEVPENIKEKCFEEFANYYQGYFNFNESCYPTYVQQTFEENFILNSENEIIFFQW